MNEAIDANIIQVFYLSEFREEKKKQLNIFYVIVNFDKNKVLGSAHKSFHLFVNKNMIDIPIYILPYTGIWISSLKT